MMGYRLFIENGHEPKNIKEGMMEKAVGKDWETAVNVLIGFISIISIITILPVEKLYRIGSWWKTALFIWLWAMACVGCIILWNKLRVDTPRDAAQNLKRLALIMSIFAIASIVTSIAIDPQYQKAIRTDNPAAPIHTPVKAAPL